MEAVVVVVAVGIAVAMVVGLLRLISRAEERERLAHYKAYMEQMERERLERIWNATF